MYCIVLYCIVLHCITLHCVALMYVSMYVCMYVCMWYVYRYIAYVKQQYRLFGPQDCLRCPWCPLPFARTAATAGASRKHPPFS